LFGVDQPTGLEIFLRSDKSLVKGGPVSRVEPVSRIEGLEINLSAFRKLRRLVQQEPTVVHMGFQRHVQKVPQGVR